MGTVAASLCDANLATCGLLHPLDCRLRNCWSLILSASEAKYRPEDDSQESETDSKPGTFTEALGHIDAQNNQNDEVNKGNQHQEDPPPGSSDDLAPNIKVINWDDAGPARLAGFCENFPHRHDYEQRDEQSNDRRDWAGSLALSAVFDLREQGDAVEKEILRELDD